MPRKSAADTAYALNRDMDSAHVVRAKRSLCRRLYAEENAERSRRTRITTCPACPRWQA